MENLIQRELSRFEYEEGDGKVNKRARRACGGHTNGGDNETIVVGSGRGKRRGTGRCARGGEAASVTAAGMTTRKVQKS